MSDLAREIAQTVVRIKSEMRKAQFASRSEAGRYAANQRWKNQGKKTPTTDNGGKTPKQKYDFSPQDYKMVRDAMPQLGAADAKKLTQYLLDNNAFGDTSEMSNQEMSNEFALYLDDALGDGSSKPKGIKVDFRPEDPEPTRNDVGDIKKASLFVQRLKRDLTIAAEGVGRDRDAVPEYTNRLKGAKAVLSAKTKGEGAKIVRELFDKAEKYQKEYLQAKVRLSEGANNNVRQNLLGSMGTTEPLALAYFQQGDGAQDCWEMRFDQSIATYPEMQKAKSFASRSEAGRYAANQRWKNQGKKGKTADDDGLSIRGMTPEKRALDELRTHVEEQRGLLDAMRGVASKAEIKQQIGLVNLAERDLRRMEQAQAKAEPPKSTHRAEYLKYRVENKESRDRVFSEANIMKAGKGLNEKYGAPLATKDDVAFAAQIKDELESAIAPLEQEVRDVLGKLDANEGDRATNLKSLQRVKTKFAALARKSEKDAKAAGNYANALEENTVRSMVSRTRTQIFEMSSKSVGFVLDQEKAIDKGLQSRMSKAKSFSSRSEAGRYAANMRWRGRTGDLTDSNIRDYATYDELTPGQKKEVERSAQELGDSMGLHMSAETYYRDNPSAFDFKPPAYKAPALVDRLRDIVDNNVNDNGDSVDDLNRRYWEDDEYIPFEDLPKGGFREQVIAAFIDAKAAGYYDEPGRLRGPYDRPSSKMTDKGYAKARAHALKGNIDNSPSDLDEYWDDNSSIFWDEYAMITDQYPKDE